MSQSFDRRDSRRLYVGPEHTVGFIINGRAFSDVRITNLSIGGCFAVVSKSEAGLFSQGAVLEQFCLEHPDMPKTLFAAEVRYAMCSSSNISSLAFLGVGLAFLNLPEDVKSALAAYLNLSLGLE